MKEVGRMLTGHGGPVKEICLEMGVADDTPMLLTKAAYGLVQAPLQWYRSVCTTMEGLGYRRLITEPCCWVYVDEQQEVQSIIHGHVDDFVFGGHKDNPVHKRLMEALPKSFFGELGKNKNSNSVVFW